MVVMFDQYQRYKTISSIINEIKKNENLEQAKILEVGANAQKNLGKFISDQIFYTDISMPEGFENEKNFFVADATNLAEVEDDEYDMVVASDVFEHIPIDLRERFLEELYRVAKYAVIFCFPFLSEYTKAAEIRANAYYKAIFDEDFIWLDEHIKNGLPDRKQINHFLEKKEINYVDFEHGDVDLWEKMTKLHFLPAYVSEIFYYREEIDRFYNEYIYISDQTDKNYRAFYILYKGDRKKYYEEIKKKLFIKTDEYEKYCNKIDVLSQEFEMLVYQLKNKEAAKNREKCNIYWRTDKGYSEENKVSVFVNYENFSIDIAKGDNSKNIVTIPQNVQEIRIDPIEGIGIVLKNLKVKNAENKLINYSCVNAIEEDEMILFLTKDPQIIIDMKEENHISISAEVVCMENMESLLIFKTLIERNRSFLEDMRENIADLKEETNLYRIKLEQYKEEATQYKEEATQYKEEAIQYEEEVMQCKEEVIQYKKEVMQCKEETTQWKNRYQAMVKSTSWKITRPFRVFVRGSKEVLYHIAPIRWAWHFCKYAQKDGLAYAWYLVKNKINQNKSEEGLYEQWIADNESSIECKERLEYNPFISVVVPVYNVKEEQLTECIESVLVQTYENWELCLADDASTWECVGKVLKKYENNPKIKVVYRKENGHISRATNSAIEVATGEFIAFMDCDDVLTPNALYEMAKKLNEDRNYDFIYSDEDKIDDDGKKRHMPHFKSDWAPDTFMSYMYTCHLAMYRKSIVDELGGLREGYEGAQDYDFTLRFTEKTNRIGHIPKILYHWRERLESTAINPESKPYILEATKRAKEDALKRRGLEGKVELIEGAYQYRVNYLPVGNPKVSIIIPSKDNLEVYERCVVTLFEKTKYKNFEVITIDNGSTDVNREGYERIANKYGIQYYYEPMNFNFSKMCNIGVEKASGSYLLFLNDDIEIINEEWLERMLGQAMLSHVGAVGAKLLYPNSNNIQHTGVINLEQGPVHCFVNMSDETIYCFTRNKLDFNYSAVTGACLLVNKEKFEKVNGFEEELPVAYNDVDFCFKLIEQGYYNVVRNDVVLYHHESVSRGYDNEDAAKMERLTRERNKLYERHPQYYQKDNFYNQNLTQNLPDFSLNVKLEEKKCDVRVIDTDKISQFKESGSIAYDINSITISQNIEIVGFAFLKGKRFNNLRKINVILRGEKESYCISTNKMYREDLKYNIEHKGKIGMTGFKCIIDRKLVQKGEDYDLFLQVDGKLCNTKRKILAT